MYDPNIGRWLTTDPKGQFASPYEGMGNNPVTGSDPTGGYDTWLGAWIGSLFGINGSVSQNTDPASLNYQQYYYARTGTPPDNGTGGAVAWAPHYGAGSEAYQLDQHLGREINQLQKEADWDKNAGKHKLSDVNPYTGRRVDPEAIDEVFPVEPVALMVAAAGESAEVELTDEELLTKAVTEAEKTVGGKAGVAGTLKHSYARNWLVQYQETNGDRGLEFNSYFNNNGI